MDFRERHKWKICCLQIVKQPERWWTSWDVVVSWVNSCFLTMPWIGRPYTEQIILRNLTEVLKFKLRVEKLNIHVWPLYLCFCALNVCVKWMTFEEGVLKGMSYLCSWWKLDVVKVLLKKTVASGMAVEVPLGQLVRGVLCHFHSWGKLWLRSCWNRLRTEY